MKNRLDILLRRPDTKAAIFLRRISPKTGQQYRISTEKRIGELAIAVPMSIASLPLSIGFATAIAVGERRDPLYRQQRIGRSPGDTVQITKISSMRPGSDAPEIFGSAGSKDTNGELLNLKKDPRVTRIGRLMRPIEADELPQLWDVIRGRLSLVGLRAIPPVDYEKLRAVRTSSHDFSTWEKAYFEGKPGTFNLHAAFDVKRKVDNTRRYHWDTFYAKHASLGLDLYIIYRSFCNLMRGQRQRPSTRKRQAVISKKPSKIV